MPKGFQEDPVDYSFLIVDEFTWNTERDMQMLYEWRNRNRENANLVRWADRFLLISLEGEEKERYENRLFTEVHESHREAIIIISKALKQVVRDRSVRCKLPETWPARCGRDRIHLSHTDRQVILKIDNPYSEFLKFLIDYFRAEPRGSEVFQDEGNKTYIYCWEKKEMGPFKAVPDEVDYLFTFGSALMGHGLYSYAAFRFQEILKSDPDDHETLLRLSRCLMEMRQYESPIGYLRRVISIHPDDSRVYSLLGECFQKLGLYGKALENYIRAMELGEDDRETHRTIGDLHYRLEDYGQAIEAYRRAVEVASVSDFLTHMIWEDIGLAYKELAQFDQAIEAFRKYAELEPEWSDPHRLRGEVYEEMGDLERAIEAYQKAVEIGSRYSAYLSLGRAYQKSNRISEARDSYQEALKVSPRGEEARAALFRIDHPDIEELEDEMHRVVKEHPFLDGDPDAVPVIYEEAKRRKAEREKGELARKHPAGVGPFN